MLTNSIKHTQVAWKKLMNIQTYGKKICTRTQRKQKNFYLIESQPC